MEIYTDIPITDIQGPILANTDIQFHFEIYKWQLDYKQTF